MVASFELYKRILENRPLKLTPEEAEYGPGEGQEVCKNCMHFFIRKVDGFTVCEVVRPEDEETEAIQPNYKCRFMTDDGENYPLLED